MMNVAAFEVCAARRGGPRTAKAKNRADKRRRIRSGLVNAGDRECRSVPARGTPAQRLPHRVRVTPRTPREPRSTRPGALQLDPAKCATVASDSSGRVRRIDGMRRTALVLICLLASGLSLPGRVLAQEKKEAPPPLALKVGDEAPDFTLTDDSGAKVTLSSFRGKK